MRMHALAVLVLGTGCGSVESTKRDAAVVDTGGGGGEDAPGDSGPTCMTWTATNFTPCTTDALPTVGLTIPADATIDTGSGVVTVGGQAVTVATALVPQSGGVRDLRLISLASLQIDAAGVLTITGDKPVLLAVHGDATIGGSILLAGTFTTPGPGGDDPFACATSKGGNGGDSGDTADGGGGGGGAGYGVAGSNGGAGGGSGGPGGVASADATLSPLRGGCQGGTGGPNGGVGGLPGGKGGGAIQISARGSISVTGTIDAGGGGGNGFGTGGAGGGGSGGAIFLETGSGGVLVSASAKVCANGGSGGEGSDDNFGAADGNPGSCSETIGAITTDSVATGGTGGQGGRLNDPDGTAGGQASNFKSGGGGGGAVGRIRFKSGNVAVDAASTVTPAHGS